MVQKRNSFLCGHVVWEREAGYSDILPAQGFGGSFGAFSKAQTPPCLNSAAGMVFCEACFFFFPQLMLRPHCAKKTLSHKIKTQYEDFRVPVPDPR